jgi:hypothetical protein
MQSNHPDRNVVRRRHNFDRNPRGQQTGMDLKKATPTTIAEFVAKWQIVRSKLSLATMDSTMWLR